MRNLLLVAALAIALGAAGASAGTLSAFARATSATEVTIDWAFTEDAGSPAGHPEWVGCDLWRSSGCDAGVRVNDTVFPRTFGQSFGGRVVDTPPAPGVYAYEVRKVDANRDPVGFGAPDCWPPCPVPAYASLPLATTPLLVGTVVDQGWSYWITPCASGCAVPMYVDKSPDAIAALAPWAGTAQVVRVYGTTQCGMVEGCAIALDHVEAGQCGVTATLRRTWGTLKRAYR